MLTRRFLLSTVTPAIAAAALVGCTTTTVNGVTTVTLNVAQVNGWAQAVLNSIALVAGLTGVVGTPVAATIMALEPVVSADLTAFDTATNGSLVLTFDSTSPSKVASSLLQDAQTVLSAVVAAVPQVPSAMEQTAQEYLQALKTVVGFFQAAMGSVAASAVKAPMTEAQALKVLNVH